MKTLLPRVDQSESPSGPCQWLTSWQVVRFFGGVLEKKKRGIANRVPTHLAQVWKVHVVEVVVRL